MFKVLVLFIAIILLYLGFNVVSGFDGALQISLFNYQVEMTAFTFIAAFILLQIAFLMILKFVFLIFGVPLMIRDKFKQHKSKNTRKKLLGVIADLMMGNNDTSLNTARKMTEEFNQENPEIANLILAGSEKKLEKKILYLKELVDKKHYSVYAAKNLAEIFYDSKRYGEAEEYATRAFREKDTDTELMLILIRIYAKIRVWRKLVFVVSKMQRASKKCLTENAKQIAGYYYIAAKDYLIEEKDDEALQFLEYALELKPDYLEALNLFVELNVNQNNSSAILKIMKTAFTAKPSFEVAQLYAKNSHSSPDAIYGTLASIVRPAENNALFLAIAAYLGLNDRIEELKEPKLITYDNKST